MLALSTWLEPDPRGFGTHQQFGTGPCGMLIQTGLPCPTCGMTTAFAHTVRGQWGRAFWVQPAGFVLALATMICVGGAGWVLVRGRWPVVNLFWVTPFRLFLALLVLALELELLSVQLWRVIYLMSPVTIKWHSSFALLLVLSVS